ncbi:hypothetical protein SRIMM317S_06371 [Streptomyces rimosus subsp. rimosus]
MAIWIDTEYNYYDFLSSLDCLRRVINAVPSKVGNRHESCDSVKVDERAEIGHGMHSPPAYLPGGHGIWDRLVGIRGLWHY